MVTKKKSTSEKEEKKGRVKVGKLQLNKETIKDLTGSEQKQIKGGIIGILIGDLGGPGTGTYGCPPPTFPPNHTCGCAPSDGCGIRR